MSNTRSGNQSRRPTKAERREEARLEREQIQRKMASRKRNRKIGMVLVALAAVVAIIAVVITSGGGNAVESPQALLAKAASEEKVAGCGTVKTTPNYANALGADPSIDHAHIGDTSDPNAPTKPPPLSSYPTWPPASGPHEPAPLGPLAAGVYSSPPDTYAAIHSLEHGAAIIWYSPAVANSDAVNQIKDFYRQTANVGQSKVILAPYDYASQGAQGQLPAGVQMALVAWHRLQTCAQPNLAAAFDFSSQYANSYPGRNYIGVARESNSGL